MKDYEEFISNIDELLEKRCGDNHNITYSIKKKPRSKYHILTFDFTNFQSKDASSNGIVEYLDDERIITVEGKEMHGRYYSTGDILEAIVGI